MTDQGSRDLARPRTTRRRLLTATLAGTAGALAPPLAAPAVAQATKRHAGKTIRYQQRDSAVEDFVRKVFAPRFEDETGAKVIIEDIPQPELFAKAQVMAAAGQLGDLIFGFDNPWLAAWAAKGMLRPLDDAIRAEGYDLGQFYPAAVEALTVGGKVYGLPTAGHPGVVNIFFNRRLLAEAGVMPPDARFPDDAWAWDDVLAAARKLVHDANGDGRPDRWGFVPAKFNPVWANNHLRPFGGEILSPDGRRAVIGDAKGQAAYRYLHDLTYKHKVAPAPADIPPNTNTEKMAGQYFAAEQVAMFEDATILITTMDRFVQGKFDWGVFPMPPGPAGSRGATMFLNTTSITSQSKHPDVAWDFLKLICSHDAGAGKLLMNSGSPGVRPDVFLDPEVTARFPWYKVGHKVMAEARPVVRPHNLRAAQVADAIFQIEGEIWLDRIGPEEGAMKLQRTIQGILDEPA